MRRWIITVALLANALAAGSVLVEFWYRSGWGHAPRPSATTAQVMIAAAVAAFALNLLLVPVLGISFWARDRGTRRLEARLAEPREAPPPDEPLARPIPPGGRWTSSGTDESGGVARSAPDRDN